MKWRLKIFSSMALVFLLIQGVIYIQHQNTVNKILKNPTSFSQCNYISTASFSDGNRTSKEYLFYRCRLDPDIRTLIYYYDIKNSKVSNYKIVNTNYETIENASPYTCSLGITNRDKNNLYERCSIYIKYRNYVTGTKELFFSTPATLVINKELIQKEKESGYIMNIDDFR